MKLVFLLTLYLVISMATSLPVEKTSLDIVPESANILNVLLISDAMQQVVVRQKRQQNGNDESMENSIN